MMPIQSSERSRTPLPAFSSSRLRPDDFLAVPYADEGRSPEGADCYGLIWLWYRDVLEIDIPIFDDVPPGNMVAVNAMIEQHKSEWLEVEIPCEHDICVMRGIGFRGAGHMGVVQPRRRLLHTTQDQGARIERLSDPTIKSRIIEFRRHKSLA